ncbi:MAG: hypothetical protein JWM98_547 [Thermoleophilia bacterium]|nr:hypothetical protein [Thermoleophilia bacterium]
MRLVAYGVLFGVGVWFGLVRSAFDQLDTLEQRAEFRQVPGALLASDGRTVLRTLRAPESRRYVEADDLPQVVVDAVVAAEDRRFFQHSGIDVRGIGRAALADLRARSSVQGGSTITQQLVKNAYVGPDRSLARKSREAILAVALETRWSKRRILAAYLNTAYFGNGFYGLADASAGYLHVAPSRLRPAQAALLGALLRSPEGNSPTRSPLRARAARLRVLTTMRSLGTLDAAEAKLAEATPLPRPDVRAHRGKPELAPQFSDSVVGDLIEHFGVRRALGGGLRVRTTLDADMQRAARDAVAGVGELGLDAALVAIDPRTGEVRAMVNGGGAARTAFNVALDGQRQPGSAFKPFMLAAAYQAGLTPRTTVTSAPFSKAYPGGSFSVTNGGGYAGRTTLERATWQSDNTVYARLQDQLGIQSAIDEAHAAGIRSRMDPVPALVLGALPQGTTPTELAHAYATFAAHGQRTALAAGGGPRTIAGVVDRRTSEHWRPQALRRTTIPRGVADLVTDTLRGVVRSGTGTAADIGRPVAGKTGTTEDYRDAWFVGYTPDLVAAVWVGHAEGGVPMRTENGGGPVTGGSIPARIWHDFAKEALADSDPVDFDLQRPTYVTVTIDEETGLLAGVWCAHPVQATYIKGKEPTAQTIGCVERDRPVPDLVGMSEADARAALTDGEFEGAVSVQRQLVTDPAQGGIVLEQDPPAPTRIFRDDPVALVVGDSPVAP